MSNHEEKDFTEFVDVLMAFQRTKFTDKHACIRHVVKRQEDIKQDIDCLEAKLKVLGGEWRIHKTVNKRDVEKARKWLLKHLIDHPEKASFVDSLWRTALLQTECIYGEKHFMLDVDTKEADKILVLDACLVAEQAMPILKVETPKGFHVITKPFDTREVLEQCKGYVTLLRDGYHYLKTVKEPTMNLTGESKNED